MQFGERPQGEIIERPGAYALVLVQAGRVAVVVVGGAPHLPGGGIEVGEGAVDALFREVLEETGLRIEVVRQIGTARQFVQRWNKVGAYFLCRAVGDGNALEADHVLEWWAPSRAVRDLTHEAQRWMVRQLER